MCIDIHSFFINRAQELVALSGAHTIGGKGFGSPVVFDNSYYKILAKKSGSSSGTLPSCSTSFPFSQ